MFPPFKQFTLKNLYRIGHWTPTKDTSSHWQSTVEKTNRDIKELMKNRTMVNKIQVVTKYISTLIAAVFIFHILTVLPIAIDKMCI